MPHDPLKCLGRLSSTDLPVLPFLAPRAFQPWPSWASTRRPGGRKRDQTLGNKLAGGDNERAPDFRVAGSPTCTGYNLRRQRIGYLSPSGLSEGALLGKRHFSTRSRLQQSLVELSAHLVHAADPVEPSAPKADQTQDDRHFTPSNTSNNGQRQLPEPFEYMQTALKVTASSAGASEHSIPPSVTVGNENNDDKVNSESANYAEFHRGLTYVGDRLPNARRLRRARLRARKQAFLMKYRTTRPKYASLGRRRPETQDGGQQFSEARGSEVNWFSSVWTKAMARLNAPHDSRIQERLRLYNFGIHADAEGWVKEISSEGWSPESLRAQWQIFKTKFGKDSLIEYRWAHVMLWILYMHPERSLDFLEATHVAPFPSPYSVVDTLEYAVCYEIRHMPVAEQWKPDKFLTLLKSLCRPDETPSLPPVTQKTIFHAMTHCNLEQLSGLHDLLMKGHVYLHSNTLLQLAQRYAELGNHERALVSLRAAITGGAVPDSVAVLSLTATILRQSAAEEFGYLAGPQIIAQILEMGITLNTTLYNIIILNAIEAEDLNTAWRIYDLLHERNNYGSAYTYAIILKACKISDDPELVTKVIRDARDSSTFDGNPVIVTEMLHCIYLIHKRRGSTDRLFDAIRQAYCNFFQSRPIDKLQLHKGLGHTHSPQLGIHDPETKPYGKDIDRMEPAPPTLGILLSVYIETCTSLSIVRDVYTAFRQHVCCGDPLIAPLAETDHAYNVFIKAFGRSKATLHLCTQVLKDMASPLPDPVTVPVRSSYSKLIPETASDVPLTAYRSIVPASPTVQTWTIVAQAFIHHGQAAAAEKVLKLMEGRKLEPNEVTWNVLVAGYAKLQDVNGVVDAMQRMEASGHEMGGRTLDALGRVEARKDLMRRLGEAAEAEEEIVPDAKTLKHAPVGTQV